MRLWRSMLPNLVRRTLALPQMNRQKLLDKDAMAAHEKADQVAKERALWISRQRAREGKEKTSKEFLAKERKLCLQEWKEDQVQEPGHGPKRWLWPVARDHPRMWIAGQDIPVREKDREQSTSWQSSPGARAKVTLSPTVHRSTRPVLRSPPAPWLASAARVCVAAHAEYACNARLRVRIAAAHLRDFRLDSCAPTVPGE